MMLPSTSHVVSLFLLITATLGQETSKPTPCYDLLNALEFMGEMQAYLQGMLISGIAPSDTQTRRAVSQMYSALDVAVVDVKTIRKSEVCKEENAVTIGQQARRVRIMKVCCPNSWGYCNCEIPC